MFYANIFDPLLILSQMTLLQSAFYLLVGAWLVLFSITFGTALNLHAVFAASQLQLSQNSGWPSIGAFLFVAPMIGYLLLPIVGRAKQCLDFTLTLYFLHFLLCTLYEGALPSTWAWWCVNLLACVLSVVLGEYLCLQKELEAIPMTSDEREARERRAAKQNQLNEATKAERQSMLEEEKGVRGDRGVTTTTIRLAPTNVFNV